MSAKPYEGHYAFGNRREASLFPVDRFTAAVYSHGDVRGNCGHEIMMRLSLDTEVCSCCFFTEKLGIVQSRLR